MIVPLVAIKSTVVDKLLLIVVTEMLDADIVSAIILDVLIFTGEKVVVVRLTMLAFVALRFSNEPLVALTVVVVYVNVLFGGHPEIEVWKLIYYMMRY